MEAIISVGIAYSQLLDDIKAVIRYELQNHAPLVPAGNTVQTDELLTIREAAQMLDVTVQTIHEHKRKGLLPYKKLGSRTYFLRTDLLDALQGHQRTVKPGKRGNRG